MSDLGIFKHLSEERYGELKNKIKPLNERVVMTDKEREQHLKECKKRNLATITAYTLCQKIERGLTFNDAEEYMIYTQMTNFSDLRDNKNRVGKAKDRVHIQPKIHLGVFMNHKMPDYYKSLALS